MVLYLRTVTRFGAILQAALLLLVLYLTVNCSAGNPISQSVNLLNSSTTASLKQKQEIVEEERRNSKNGLLSPPQFQQRGNCPDGQAYVDEVRKCLKQGKYKMCFIR